VPYAETSRSAFRLVSRDHILSLADQVVVSGTGFLTTLVIARLAGAEQLGVFAVGMSLLGSFLLCQDSLILQPYTIQRHSAEGTPAERAGASLILSFLFSSASVLLLITVAFGFLQLSVGPDLVVVTWAVAGIVPFALTRDFARRFSFAHFEFAGALLLDVAVALLQLLILCWLGWSGRMSAVGAWAALGGAYAVAAAAWLYCGRAEFALHLRLLRPVLKQTWELAKWLFAAHITMQVQGNITYWLSIVIAGAAATGVFAACMSIMAFANPLLQGLLGNTLMPKSVVAWKNGGGPALWREAIRNTALIAALVASFTVAVLIGGEQLMHLLFHGNEFEGHRHTLTVLALAMCAAALGGPASIALATMERPRAIVLVGMIGAAVTVTFVWLLMIRFGLLGMAYGLLAGNLTSAVGCWFAFFSLVRAKPNVGDGRGSRFHVRHLYEAERIWRNRPGRPADEDPDMQTPPVIRPIS
jgi:O-antigen/teichoic acid export membrane protein